MIQGTLATQALSGIGYSVQASGGRMTVPVSRSSYIYSHFRHVSGTPAPEGGEGVSISKLKILDVLIDRLSKVQKQPEISLSGMDTRTDNQLNAMIDQLKAQARQAQAENSALPYKQNPLLAEGELFSLSAG
jgi:hypothetical protein